MKSVVIVGDDRFATQLSDLLVCSLPGQPRIQRVALDDPDLPTRLAGADWVIEMAGHALEQKRAVLRHCAHGATGLVTSDASVITRHELLAGLPPDFGNRYAVAHFFFPLTHCPLVELVAASEPDPRLKPLLSDQLRHTLEHHMGRTVVEVSDNPGFIANRLGLFLIASGLALLTQGGPGPAAIDRAGARSLGLPRTGLFGAADLIGHATLKLLLLALCARLSPADPLRLVAPGAVVRLDDLRARGRERFIDRADMRQDQHAAPGGPDVAALTGRLQADRDSYMRLVCRETGIPPAGAADIMRKSYGWDVPW